MCVWLFFLVIPIPRSTDYLLMDTQSFMIRWSFRCFSYKQDSMHWSYTGLHACTYSMFASTSLHHCATEGESTLYRQNMRSKSSFKRICNLLVKPPHFTKKNVKDKPEKWETFFVAIFSKSKIGNKFWPPKSSMGTLFQPVISKNQSFFVKRWRIPPVGVPQQHHLSQQHFGGHVA